MSIRVNVPEERRVELYQLYSHSARFNEVEFDTWVSELLGRKCFFENPGWVPNTFPTKPSNLYFMFDDERDALKFKLEHLSC